MGDGKQFSLYTKFGDTVRTRRENGARGTYLYECEGLHYVLIKHKSKQHRYNADFNEYEIIRTGEVTAYENHCWNCLTQVSSSDNETCPICQYLRCSCGSCSEKHNECIQNPEFLNNRLYWFLQYEEGLIMSPDLFPASHKSVAVGGTWQHGKMDERFQLIVEKLLKENIRFGLVQMDTQIHLCWAGYDMGNYSRAVECWTIFNKSRIGHYPNL